jgi:hypothetical protein
MMMMHGGGNESKNFVFVLMEEKRETKWRERIVKYVGLNVS